MAAAAKSSYCELCKIFISKSYERKNLHTSKNAHVLALLGEFSQKLLGQDAMNKLFPSSKCLCRTCFRRLENLPKVRREVQDTEQKICEQLRAISEAQEFRLCLEQGIAIATHYLSK